MRAKARTPPLRCVRDAGMRCRDSVWRNYAASEERAQRILCWEPEAHAPSPALSRQNGQRRST